MFNIILFLVAGCLLIYSGLLLFDDAEYNNSRFLEIFSYTFIGSGIFGLYVAFNIIQDFISVYTLL